MGQTGAEDQLTQKLEKQLLAVMRRAGRLTELNGWSSEPRSFVELENVVWRVSPVLYQQDSIEALRQTLRKAFRRTRWEPVPNAAGHSYGEIGERLLGLELLRDPDRWDILEHQGTRMKEYDKLLRECLIELFGDTLLDDEKRNQVTKTYRRLLAEALIGMLSDENQSGEQVQPAVPRMKLAVRLSKLVRSQRLINVWGFSGDGKTTLVRNFVESVMPGADVVYIDFASSVENTETTYVDHQIRSELKVRSADVSNDLLGALKEFLQTTNSCDIVILDDLSDLLARLLIPTIKVQAISISHRPLESRFGVGLRVGELDEPEALELALKFLPGSESERLKLLCRRLGHRCLPIVVACQVVAGSTSVSLESVIEAVDENVADAFEAMQRDLRRPSDRAVTAVFQVMLNGLRDVDVVAWQQLLTAAWICGSTTDGRLLEAMLVIGQAPKPYRFGSGLSELHRSSAIVRSGGQFAVNLLTLDITRWLTHEEGMELLGRLAPLVLSSAGRALAFIRGGNDALVEAEFQNSMYERNQFLSLLTTDIFSSFIYRAACNSNIQGAARTGTNTWLYWNFGHIDKNAAQGIGLGLVSLDYDPQVRLWLSGAAGVVLAHGEREFMLSLIRCWQYAEHDWFAYIHIANSRNNPSDPALLLLDRPTPFVQPSFNLLPDSSERHHRLIFPYSRPPQFADGFGGSVWSACGWPVLPAAAHLDRYLMDGQDFANCETCSDMDEAAWSVHNQAFADLRMVWDLSPKPAALAMFAHATELMGLPERFSERFAWIVGLTAIRDIVTLSYALMACQWLHSISMPSSDSGWPPGHVDKIEAETLRLLKMVNMGSISTDHVETLTVQTFLSFARDYDDANNRSGRQEAVEQAAAWWRRAGDVGKDSLG